MTRTKRITLPALSVALGLGGLSIALGLLYREMTLRDLALARLAVEYETRYESIDEDEAWAAWGAGYWLGALGSGTLGVAMLGFGGVLLIGEGFTTVASTRRVHHP